MLDSQPHGPKLTPMVPKRSTVSNSTCTTESFLLHPAQPPALSAHKRDTPITLSVTVTKLPGSVVDFKPLTYEPVQRTSPPPPLETVPDNFPSENTLAEYFKSSQSPMERAFIGTPQVIHILWPKPGSDMVSNLHTPSPNSSSPRNLWQPGTPFPFEPQKGSFYVRSVER